MAPPNSEKDLEQSVKKLITKLLPDILKNGNNTVRNGIVSSVSASGGQIDMRMIGSAETLSGLPFIAMGEVMVGSRGLVLSSDPTVKSANYALIFSNTAVNSADTSLSGNVMENGQIVVSVVSSDLIVSLRGQNGSILSAGNELSVGIGGTRRSLSSSKTITLPDGVNYFNSGSAELATQIVQYFTYIVWNTTPTFARGEFIISRIPYATTYADFSSTNTNEKYGAYSGNDEPQATDKVVLVGRFDATLSAGAGYTWSVSGSGNVFNTPIYHTDTLTWVPTISVSGGTAPTYTAVFVNRYWISGKMLFYNFFWQNVTGGTAGSGTNSILLTTPMDIGVLTQGATIGTGYAYEDSGTQRGVFTRKFTSANTVSIDYAAGTITVIAGNDQSSVARIISINGQFPLV